MIFKDGIIKGSARGFGVKVDRGMLLGLSVFGKMGLLKARGFGVVCLRLGFLLCAGAVVLLLVLPLLLSVTLLVPSFCSCL